MSLKGTYRHITLRHERHLIRGTSPALAPGEARFSSYYLPALPAGKYTMAIKQTITAPESTKEADPALRTIEVLAPEWALSAASNGDSETTNASEEEAAVVLSVFPASGQVAPSFRTLPHMVLRDAQLPWVRSVSKKTDENNVIPWFALIVFSADELELDSKDGSDYFSGVNGSINDTLGWDVTVDRIEDIGDRVKDNGVDRLANFIPKPLDPDVKAKAKTSLIAVKSDIFGKLFPSREGETTFDVSPYRFMSHVRTVPTQGTLSAGIVADNDHDSKLAGTQTLSIVVSHRLGPTDVKVPTPVLAHLVSLQGIDGRQTSDINGKKHVLMTSLFSWSYNALPPDAPDVVSMLQYLGTDGKGLSVLRTDMGNGSPEPKYASKEEEIVSKRQRDGYNIVRHRVITGEQTAAIYRGPLTPTRVPHPLNNGISFQSNFGTDLQILDPDIGLMDISYASAWQLGKTLAMADPAFTSALSRLRMLVNQQALNTARKTVVQAMRSPSVSTVGRSSLDTKLSIFSDRNPYVTYMGKDEIKSDMLDIVKALNGMNEKIHESGTAFSTNRWRRREPKASSQSSGMFPSTTQGRGEEEDDVMSLRSAHIYHQMPEHALFHTLDHANTPGDNGKPYNYHEIPSNTDYAIIQEWVLDKLHLSSIPAHYLFPDPSYIPVETLRFFHIDSNWMDALVDGSLSLANHLASEPEEDYCRTALKETLNRYFKSSIAGDYRQQMPAYGFVLRSKLLVQFPDLAVSAEFSKDGVHSSEDWDKVKPRAPILVQRRLGPDMMLVLMDREPPGLTGVTFTLPAHQQTFTAALALNEKEIELQCKRVYATGANNPLPEPIRKNRQELLPLSPNPRSTGDVFEWDARTLKIKKYAELIHENLLKEMPKDQYTAPGPTSAVFSLQLNEPIYTLSITAEQPKPPPKTASEEDLESWTVLHEPRLFRFHPPAFPTDRYLPEKPMKVFSNSKLPEFVATRLKIVEEPSPRPSNTAIHTSDSTTQGFAIINKKFPNSSSSSSTVRIPPSLDLPIRPTDQPVYEFGLFPIGRKTDGYIPSTNDRPLDLIFSIVRDARATWPMRVLEWNLTIMIKDPEKPSRYPLDPGDYNSPRALLRTDKPAGPPPIMLSNMRYNVVIKKWDTKANLVHIDIVPRSAWGVHIDDTQDASFLLPMANIYPWDVPEGGEYPVGIELRSVMVQDEPNGQKWPFVHPGTFKFKPGS
ncbi:hypothetical protein CC79DRAFT_1328344 [Sarocladium strictum]